MSELTKQQLTVENSNSFPNNNTGFITPTLLRTFNGNIIDSMVDEVTYNADSASWTSDITALEQFSSSLDVNFVSTAELNASSSTLQNNINTKLNTSSFNAYTASQEVISASFNTRINSVTGSATNTGSLLLTASAVSNVITFTKGDGTTFPITVATGSSTSTDTGSLLLTASVAGNVITFTKGNGSTFPITVATGSGGVSGDFVTTSSFNSYTASASTNVSASINAATSSLSASLSSSIGALSSSVSSSIGSLSASIAVTDLAQSSSIAQLLGFSSSLDTTFATDAQLSASASTLQNDINTRLLTSSFQTYTSSITSQIAGLGTAIAGKVSLNSPTNPQTITGSLIISGSSTNGQGDTLTLIGGPNPSNDLALHILSGSVEITTPQGNGAHFYSNAPITSSNLRINGTAVIKDLFVSGTWGGTGSGSLFVENSITASVISASQYIGVIQSASFAQTASFLLGSVASASFAQTASIANNLVVRATNNNASTLVRGTVVRISGANGDNPLFNSASWDNDSTSANALGILQSDVLSGATGSIVVTGVVVGVNTDGMSAGNILYLSASGQFTNVQPQAPLHIVTLGEVLRVQQNNGSIFVNISNGWELDELHNVRITSPLQGNLLAYNSASGLWQNSSSLQLGLTTTSSFNSFTASVITTGSAGLTQSITGSLIVSGATFNGKIEPPALSIGVTNLDTLFESTASTSASSVVSQIDFTRLGAGPTGDLTGVRLQTLSGSDTTGDTLLSRVTTGVNRHTTTEMTGSVVNTAILSTWATGSAGTRVAYSSQVNANAQSQSATLTLTAGNPSSNYAGGTASLQAGRVNIGTTGASIISTGSFTHLGSLVTSQGITANNGGITATSGSINGEFRVNGSINITGSNPTIQSGSLSGSLVSTLTDIYPSTPQGNFIVTLDSASMATLLSGAGTNANTIYFVI
jgi:hypothetical protein